jgi:hypothetical protein
VSNGIWNLDLSIQSRIPAIIEDETSEPLGASELCGLGLRSRRPIRVRGPCQYLRLSRTCVTVTLQLPIETNVQQATINMPKTSSSYPLSRPEPHHHSSDCQYPKPMLIQLHQQTLAPAVLVNGTAFQLSRDSLAPDSTCLVFTSEYQFFHEDKTAQERPA